MRETKVPILYSVTDFVRCSGDSFEDAISLASNVTQTVSFNIYVKVDVRDGVTFYHDVVLLREVNLY